MSNEGSAAMPRSTSSRSLTAVLRDSGVVLVPGVWDGLSALMAKQAGFAAVCAAGVPIAASFGLPDAGLYTMSENLEAVRRIAATVDLPIIADIDTGYGNAVNVVRTVRLFESAGADAVFMEDQVAPKRCPIASTREPLLISRDEAVGKIRAAVDARASEEFLIIARTDASGEEAMERSVAYAEAGANFIMPVSRTFSSVDQLRACRDACRRPLVLSLTPSTWIARDLSVELMESLGVKIGILPHQALLAAATALRRSLKELRAANSFVDVGVDDMSFDDFSTLIGFDEVYALEEKYLPTV